MIKVTNQQLCGHLVKLLIKGDVTSEEFLAVCQELKDRKIKFRGLSINGEFTENKFDVILPLHVKLSPSFIPKGIYQ
jgi:hypothetical protein